MTLGLAGRDAEGHVSVFTEEAAAIAWLKAEHVTPDG